MDGRIKSGHDDSKGRAHPATTSSREPGDPTPYSLLPTPYSLFPTPFPP